jgi:hypothetical protein
MIKAKLLQHRLTLRVFFVEGWLANVVSISSQLVGKDREVRFQYQIDSTEGASIGQLLETDQSSGRTDWCNTRSGQE